MPFILSILFFVLASWGLQTLIQKNHDQAEKIYLKTAYQRDYGQLINARLALSRLAQMAFQTLIYRNDVVSLMAKAVNGNQAVKDKMRHQLFNRLESQYLLLKQNHVRQLHFHLPHEISFLRFHRPKKYGDSLTQVRQSLVLVNEFRRPIQGFEEGRIFNGFRHVYPLFYQEQFVGSVEISFGFDGLAYMMHQSADMADRFLIKKSIVSHKVFTDEKNHNYIKSDLSSRYLADRSAINAQKHFKRLSSATIMGIDHILSQKPLGQYSGKAVSVEIQKQLYTVSLVPLHNFKHQQVGYSVVYHKAPILNLMAHNYQQFKLYAMLFVGLLSLLIFIVLVLISTRVKRIEDKAVRDELTGIYNRKLLQQQFDYFVRDAKAHHVSLSIIFFDIDCFKDFNDTYGHLVGDEVLQEVARLVRSNIRNSDIVIRWGGEEFLVLLPKEPLQIAIDLAEKLRRKVEQAMFTRQKLSVKISLGVVELKENETLDSFIDRADACLYQAKQNGRNQVISELDCHD